MSQLKTDLKILSVEELKNYFLIAQTKMQYAPSDHLMILMLAIDDELSARGILIELVG